MLLLHKRARRARPRADPRRSCLSVCSQLNTFQLEDHLGRNRHATGRMPLLLAVHPQVTAAHRTGELLGPLCPSGRRGSRASGGRLPISTPMMPARAQLQPVPSEGQRRWLCQGHGEGLPPYEPSSPRRFLLRGWLAGTSRHAPAVPLPQEASPRLALFLAGHTVPSPP